MAQSVGAVALDIVMGKNTVSGVAKQAMADVQKTFNDGTATIGQKVSAVGTACKNVGASLLPVSAAATGVIKSTADAAMGFETAMAQVETIAGSASVSYKGKMTDMSKAIMQLSTDTGIAAEDVAAATYSAISAGVDVSKSVEFVATANALAVGGFTQMETAVDVLTTTLNAYGEKAGTAESISDKLITTQNLGKTTVDELASSMGKVIPTASAYGISVDNLCASYVAMTKGGIATAEATTYMKSMFNELADSGSSVGKILSEKTGKSFGQLMSEGKSLADVIDILGASVDGDKEKFAQLWGSSEAGTGALAILNGGTQDFNNTLVEMGNSTGAASDAMNKMNDTSAHKMQVAMNDMKNAAIELGGAFAPVLSGIASAVGAVARVFGNLPGPVKTVIAVVLGVVAVAAPLLMLIGNIITAVGAIIPVLGALSAPVAGVITIIAGVIAVGALLISHWDTVKEVAGKVWNGIRDAVSNAVNAVKTTVLNVFSTISSFASNTWNSIRTTVTNIVSGIVNTIKSYFTGLKTSISGVLDGIKNIFSNVWTIIKNVVGGIVLALIDLVTLDFKQLKSDVSNVMSNIKNAMSNIWNSIKSISVNAVNSMKTAVAGAWTAVRDTTVNLVTGMKNSVSNTFSAIKSTVTNFSAQAVNSAVSAFNTMRTGISTALSRLKTTISTGISNAVAVIKRLPAQALQWGKDMIQGLINGIKSAIGGIGKAVNGVANKIRSVLHFSVPDEGPLTDYESWMPDFIGGMAKGIETNKYRLIDAVRGMAGEMRLPAMTAPVLQNVGRGNQTMQTGASGVNGDDRVLSLLTQFVNSMQNMSFTLPVYLGNDLIDEQIVRADDRRTVRSGGRA